MEACRGAHSSASSLLKKVCSRFEKFASVAGLLVGDAGGDWLSTFEVGARIEEGALPAGVQIGAALQTASVDGDPRLKRGAARGTPHLLLECHHFG